MPDMWSSKVYISRRLSRLRRKMMVSAKEFAGLVGVSNTTVSNWEMGYRTPSLEFQRKIEHLELAHGLKGKKPIGKYYDPTKLGRKTNEEKAQKVGQV